jgi:hypothetical protein
MSMFNCTHCVIPQTLSFDTLRYLLLASDEEVPCQVVLFDLCADMCDRTNYTLS